MLNALILSAMLIGADSDPEAVKILDTFEERVMKAKSLKMVGKMRIEGGKSDADFAVTCIVQQGGFTNNKCVMTSGQKTRSLQLISDGKSVALATEDKSAIVMKTPKHLDHCNRAMLTQMGMVSVLAVSSVNMLDKLVEAENEEFNERFFDFSNVVLKPDEKVGERTCKVLSFSSGRRGKVDNNVVLWLDAETLLPVKRFTKSNSGNTTETYQEFVID